MLSVQNANAARFPWLQAEWKPSWEARRGAAMCKITMWGIRAVHSRAKRHSQSAAAAKCSSSSSCSLKKACAHARPQRGNSRKCLGFPKSWGLGKRTGPSIWFSACECIRAVIIVILVSDVLCGYLRQLLVDRLRQVVQRGRAQNDPPSPTKACESKHPQKESVQNHGNELPVLNYLEGTKIVTREQTGPFISSGTFAPIVCFALAISLCIMQDVC